MRYKMNFEDPVVLTNKQFEELCEIMYDGIITTINMGGIEGHHTVVEMSHGDLYLLSGAIDFICVIIEDEE